MKSADSSHSCLGCGEQTLNPKFCSRSCSARYTNSVSPKRARVIRRCESCDVRPIRASNTTNLCKTCYMAQEDARIGEMTLGDSIAVYSTPRSKYNTVRHHGRKLSNLYDRCQVCGYKTILQVCHIKGIATFPLETRISTINDPSNIAILCPNHHCELDAGILSPDAIPSRG